MNSRWPLKKLSEIAKIQMGQSPKGSSYNSTGEGIPLINGPVEFGEHSFSRTKRTKFTTEPTKFCQAGDLILCVRGSTTGRMNIAGYDSCIGRGVASIRSDQYQEWINFFIHVSREKIYSLGSGSTFPNVSGSTLAKLEVPLPPLSEQKRIVAILDEVFAGIDAAIANTEKNLTNARKLFESYLNNFFTQPDDNWRSAELQEHTRFIDYRGRTPKKTEKGMRLITAKNVKMGYLQLEPQEFVNPEIYDEWMTRGIPKKGDVLFTTEAPLGNVTQLDTNEKVVFAQRVIIMQPDASVLNGSFLKFMLLSKVMQTRINEKGTGATAKGIKASLLKKIRISFPKDLQTQEEIIRKLEEFETQINGLEAIYKQKLTALNELKQSILQQAFTGQLTAEQAEQTAKEEIAA